MRVINTPYVAVIDIYDDLLNIRCSYLRRKRFYENEVYKLKSDYANYVIHDKEYFQKLCPLNIEKANMNNEYKNKILKYAETISPVYSFHVQDIVDEFVKDVV